MSSNTNDYNEIITVKENELKSLTQQRLMNLERAVKEREEVLLETIKKLEMLKEDFDYNLTLIDARDKEIQRLESSLISQQKKLKESSLTVETLRQENEYLRSQDSKLREEVEKEKENHRRTLEELRAVIQTIRFSMEEEAKESEREIDSLRKEVERGMSIREELLEKQRVELCRSYEELLHQRDVRIAEKETELLARDGLLSELRNEMNTRVRQLEYQLKTEENASQKVIEELSERLNQREKELTAKDFAIQDLRNDLHEKTKQQEYVVKSKESEWQRKIEDFLLTIKTKNEEIEKLDRSVNREKEIVVSLQQRIESLSERNKKDQESLLTDKQSLSDRCARLSSEVQDLIIEKENLLFRLGEKRVELDLLQSRQREEEQEKTKVYNQWKERNQRCLVLEQEVSRYKKEGEERQQRVDELEESCRSKDHELESLQTQLQVARANEKDRAEEINNLKERVYTRNEREKCLEGEVSELKRNMDQQQQDMDRLQSLLRDSSIEKTALEHRLESYQKQLAEMSMAGGGGRQVPSFSQRVSTPPPSLDSELPPFSPVEERGLGSLTSPAGNRGFSHVTAASVRDDNLRKENEALKATVHELRMELDKLIRQSENSSSSQIDEEVVPKRDLERSLEEIRILRKERQEMSEQNKYLRYNLREAEEALKEIAESQQEELRAQNVSELVDWIRGKDSSDSHRAYRHSASPETKDFLLSGRPLEVAGSAISSQVQAIRHRTSSFLPPPPPHPSSSSLAANREVPTPSSPHNDNNAASTVSISSRGRLQHSALSSSRLKRPSNTSTTAAAPSHQTRAPMRKVRNYALKDGDEEEAVM